MCVFFPLQTKFCDGERSKRCFPSIFSLFRSSTPSFLRTNERRSAFFLPFSSSRGSRQALSPYQLSSAAPPDRHESRQRAKSLCSHLSLSLSLSLSSTPALIFLLGHQTSERPPASNSAPDRRLIPVLPPPLSSDRDAARDDGEPAAPFFGWEKATDEREKRRERSDDEEEASIVSPSRPIVFRFFPLFFSSLSFLNLFSLCVPPPPPHPQRKQNKNAYSNPKSSSCGKARTPPRASPSSSPTSTPAPRSPTSSGRRSGRAAWTS